MCEIRSFSSDSVNDLATAMLKVQQELKPLSRDGYNGFTNSRYATLGAVMESCRQALVDAGIWVTQFPVDMLDSSVLGLVTKLVHAVSGQWQASLLVMPLVKSDPQAYGSAMTYARRYALTALVGIVTDDDDGETAVNGQPSMVTHEARKSPENRVKNAPTRQNPGTKIPKESSNDHSKINGLPHLDGVNFSRVQDEQGRPFITASGATRDKSSLLKAAGFAWDANQKIWWKVA